MRRLRSIVAAGTRTPLFDPLVSLVDRLLPTRSGALTILTYHRVDEPNARPDLMPGLISATPAGFADQMAMLVAHYRPVSLDEVLAAHERLAPLPSRAVLVTFDDGYLDFATNAWPVMRTLGVPATLFVATGFTADPTVPFWWDRLWAAFSGSVGSDRVETENGTYDVASPAAAERSLATVRDRLKTLPHDEAMTEVDRLATQLGEPSGPRSPAVLDWEGLRRLAGDGVTLAPHTRHHPLLDRIPLGRAVEEIGDSHADLEREVGPTARVLAYPSGAHGGDAVEAARRAGMTVAMTTDRGGNDVHRGDPLRLRRINVGMRATVPLVRAQLVWASSLDARRGGASGSGDLQLP